MNPDLNKRLRRFFVLLLIGGVLVTGALVYLHQFYARPQSGKSTG